MIVVLAPGYQFQTDFTVGDVRVLKNHYNIQDPIRTHKASLISIVKVDIQVITGLHNTCSNYKSSVPPIVLPPIE